MPLTPTPTLPLKREGVPLCHGRGPAPITTPNPSPSQGEVRVGVSSKLSASTKTYPRPLSLPYPLPRFLFGRRDRPMEGDQAGAQDVDVQCGSWHYMLRHGDRSAMTGAPGWAVLAITGKSRRPGAATPHFLFQRRCRSGTRPLSQPGASPPGASARPPGEHKGVENVTPPCATATPARTAPPKRSPSECRSASPAPARSASASAAAARRRSHRPHRSAAPARSAHKARARA